MIDYEIHENKDGRWGFTITKNGETILKSTRDYARSVNARQSVRSIFKSIQDAGGRVLV